MSGIGDVVSVGPNYTDHTGQTDAPVPDERILFSGHISAMSDPRDAVILLPGSTKLQRKVSDQHLPLLTQLSIVHDRSIVLALAPAP